MPSSDDAFSDADIRSGGGDITINGDGASTGLILSAVGIYSGVGSISLLGSGGGIAGSGVSIGQGSVVSATSGDVSVSGVSDAYYAVLMSGGAEIVMGGVGAVYGFADGKRTGFDTNGMVVRVYEGDKQGKVVHVGAK